MGSSSLTRDWAQAPILGAGSLSYWTIREESQILTNHRLFAYNRWQFSKESPFFFKTDSPPSATHMIVQERLTWGFWVARLGLLPSFLCVAPTPRLSHFLESGGRPSPSAPLHLGERKITRQKWIEEKMVGTELKRGGTLVWPLLQLISHLRGAEGFTGYEADTYEVELHTENSTSGCNHFHFKAYPFQDDKTACR